MRVTLLCMVISVVCTYEHWQLRRLVQSNPQALPIFLQHVGRTMPRQRLEVVHTVRAFSFGVLKLEAGRGVRQHTHTHCCSTSANGVLCGCCCAATWFAEP